ncbi:Kelch-type beta propeller [Niveomyces insectorum RCEF 264]|uniref:Kelch-type beta propeller n=1 Tax=Niveomyces insectorum RCEF 264 TaxID=1081102 RepID=A0A167N027_9HYPO|nr:Kelch-type beta propeller [Niveomyces insectorum RCEF 264]
MADPGRQTPRSPLRAKVIRAQKIQPLLMSPAEDGPMRPLSSSATTPTVATTAVTRTTGNSDDKRRRDDRDRSASTASTSSATTATTSSGVVTNNNNNNTSGMPPIVRGHTPGHLSSRSQDRRRKPPDLAIRQRSQSSGSLSVSSSSAAAGPTSSAGVSLTASPSASHLSIVSTPNSARTPGPSLPPPPIPLPPPSSSTAVAHAPLLPPPPPPPLSSSSTTMGSSTSSSPSARSPYRRGATHNDQLHDNSESPTPAQAMAADAMEGGRRPIAMRSTSAIASKPGAYGNIGSSSSSSLRTTGGGSSRGPPRSASGGRSGGGGGSSAFGGRGKNGSGGSSGSIHGGGGGSGGRSGSVMHTPAFTAFPPLVDPRTAADVPPAPSSGMYWSRAPLSGVAYKPLRAHTATLVGSNVFVFGGCDARTCFNDLYVLDADAFHWTKPPVVGEPPLPLRAMTCTAVGKKLVVFGGGDGPEYYNDVYVLDTTNCRWSRPRIAADRPVPAKRRAHTACLYRNGLYVFGGGDGVRALNDVWRLDVSDTSKMAWKLISPGTPWEGDYGGSGGGGGGGSSSSLGVHGGPCPKARGYHTANMVGSKLIVFGGSDGGECFNDVWVYDVETHVWRAVAVPVTYRRLSHTATIVGSYLFVVGGHDGTEYANDVLLLNLVTMTWDRRKVYGVPPSGRGYHGTVLYDSRLLVIGGVFGDVWLLELAVHAYYSQISHFSIEV